MNYSAQAIIIDTEKNVYLENNTVIRSLSFIGGKREIGESYEDALIREIWEEL